METPSERTDQPETFESPKTDGPAADKPEDAWSDFERARAEAEGLADPPAGVRETAPLDPVAEFHRDATEREKVLREVMKKVVVAAGGKEGDEVERAKVDGKDVGTPEERMADWHRVHLVGLDHSVKDMASLRRKVAGYEADGGKEGDPLANVKDGVRFTIQLPDAWYPDGADKPTYTDGANKALTALSALGYEQLSVRNSWEDPVYRGVNTSWRDPESGKAFEVQFHTPLSFRAKQATHATYAKQRDPGTTEARADELRQKQAVFTHFVTPPPGAETIVGQSRSEEEGS